MKRLRVYISGPLTTGDEPPEECVAAAERAFHQLRSAGFAPWVPHWSLYCKGADRVPHAEWLEIDLPWVEAADAVLRLPGKSAGAEQEVDHAALCGVPVFRSVAELITWGGVR